jgi:hypothetical protein
VLSITWLLAVVVRVVLLKTGITLVVVVEEEVECHILPKTHQPHQVGHIQ